MIGHLDCTTGVSGDKFLGAVLDVGEASGLFTGRELQRLVHALAPEAEVVVRRSLSAGVSAVTVRVEASGDVRSRHWSDIREAIVSAALPAAVRDSALKAFTALATAEARVHGTTIDEVHFHEVGALDSIMDVVGVCAGLVGLGIESLTASPIATGWGTVDTSHGTLSVPAPATAALLTGIATVSGPSRKDGSAPGELTTPTGAALVGAWVSGYGPSLPMTPAYIGYGMGTRDIGSPNVCRLIVGTPAGTSPVLAEQSVTLLEANLDHLSAEAIAFAAEELLAEGALDAWTVPVVMKKGRPGHVLSALVASADATALAGRLSALTGSLGVRVSEQPRLVADRRAETIRSPWGAVRVKVGPVTDGGTVMRPEHEDVARIARETGQPYSAIAQELSRLAREQLEMAE